MRAPTDPVVRSAALSPAPYPAPPTGPLGQIITSAPAGATYRHSRRLATPPTTAARPPRLSVACRAAPSPSTGFASAVATRPPPPPITLSCRRHLPVPGEEGGGSVSCTVHAALPFPPLPPTTTQDRNHLPRRHTPPITAPWRGVHVERGSGVRIMDARTMEGDAPGGAGGGLRGALAPPTAATAAATAAASTVVAAIAAAAASAIDAAAAAVVASRVGATLRPPPPPPSPSQLRKRWRLHSARRGGGTCCLPRRRTPLHWRRVPLAASTVAVWVGRP